MLLRPEQDGGALWDRMPIWLRIVTVIGAVIFFGGAMIAPLFWKL